MNENPLSLSASHAFSSANFGHLLSRSSVRPPRTAWIHALAAERLDAQYQQDWNHADQSPGGRLGHHRGKRQLHSSATLSRQTDLVPISHSLLP